MPVSQLVEYVFACGRTGSLAASAGRSEGRVSPLRDGGCVLPAFSVLTLPVHRGTGIVIQQNRDCSSSLMRPIGVFLRWWWLLDNEGVLPALLGGSCPDRGR